MTPTTPTTPATPTTLLTDHPAWTVRPDGTTCRLVVVGADVWLLAWDGIALVPARTRSWS
jgi:hypothetical protein